MDIEPFLDRCERYCARKSMSQARLSTLIFGSGMTLDRLHAGKGVTVRVLSRAVERLEGLEAALRSAEQNARPAA
jgi:hypothetical protein